MKYAHYYKNGKHHYLDITTSPRLTDMHSRHNVASKAAARALATKLNAQPWNF